MTKFEEVKRLQELEAMASNIVGKLKADRGSVIDKGYGGVIASFYDEADAIQYVAMRNASAWLLEVAGKFQPSDHLIAPLVMVLLRGCGADEASPMMDYIRRMAEAANIMEVTK